MRAHQVLCECELVRGINRRATRRLKHIVQDPHLQIFSLIHISCSRCSLACNVDNIVGMIHALWKPHSYFASGNKGWTRRVNYQRFLIAPVASPERTFVFEDPSRVYNHTYSSTFFSARFAFIPASLMRSTRKTHKRYKNRVKRIFFTFLSY